MDFGITHRVLDVVFNLLFNNLTLFKTIDIFLYTKKNYKNKIV